MSTDNQIQNNNKTFLGRYLTEHSVLRRYLPSDHELAILSFGCSTGEELLSMSMLFPKARIFGCDTDWHNLQAARALAGHVATIFSSNDAEIRRHGPYNIILCNSVLLCPTLVTEGRKQGISAQLWSQVLSMLDSVLKPGGILQIINSNIPFRYHPLAANYEPLRSALILGPNFVDQFDLQGRHLCSGIGGVGWSGVLSRHLGEEAWAQLLPTDLQDVHFFKRTSDGPPPAVNDEVIPNMPAGTGLASGSITYRPELTPDPRPSTHVEIDVSWTTVGAEGIRLNRLARRIWFDGSVFPLGQSIIEMTGPTATAFIEATTGRRSSRLVINSLTNTQAIHAPSF